MASFWELIYVSYVPLDSCLSYINTNELNTKYFN